MQYKGNNFKKVLGAILSEKHSQPITIANYFHMPSGHEVDVQYEYREKGKTKGHSTRIGMTKIIEATLNFDFS